MKLHSKLLQYLLCFIFLGCSKDGTNASGIVPINENSFELVNAFPQLSFVAPLDLQTPDDGTNRLFVVEQGGYIRMFPNDEKAIQTKMYLDISNRTNTSSGELGLLGMAFHPDYQSNGLFYVYYTPSAQESVVSKFQVSAMDPDQADMNSEEILLSIAQPFTNHNGGQLVFGDDGYLYIASGDGGSGGDPQGNAQNLNSLLGKILRIDVNSKENGSGYGIPPNNPYRDMAGALPEIYAYGLRNPWRISFDSQTGKLWAGDVGQGAIEEIDIIEAGGNYGWNLFEGTNCFVSVNCESGGLIPPVFQYDHSAGDKSVTGGFVYRGQEVPSLQGYYIFADFISGRIWALDAESNNAEATLLINSGINISSFGIDKADELYLCGFDGAIYHLEPK